MAIVNVNHCGLRFISGSPGQVLVRPLTGSAAGLPTVARASCTRGWGRDASTTAAGTAALPTPITDLIDDSGGKRLPAFFHLRFLIRRDLLRRLGTILQID